MATTGETAASIRAANDVFQARAAAGDASGIAALYTDDAIVMPPNSDFVRGTANIRDLFQAVADGGVTGFELTTLDLDDLGETAIEVGRYKMFAGAQVADEGKYVVVWKRGATGWRLHRDIFNSSKPK